MVETMRERVLAAVCDVLYIDEAELIDGDATDLRDLGLDSVRFVLLMKQLGVNRESELPSRLAENLSIAGWVHGAGEPWRVWVSAPDEGRIDRVPLSRSQQNLYNGVLQDSDPALYLIGKTYRFHPLELSGFLAALEATILENPVQLCVLESPATGPETVIGYPDLVLRLQFDDIVRVRPHDQHRPDRGDEELSRTWS